METSRAGVADYHVPSKDVVARYKAWRAENSELTRVPLLKGIEAATATEFETRHLVDLSEGDPVVQKAMAAVVLESNMAGLEEFGELWYKCVRAKMKRMTLCADWITLATMKNADASTAAASATPSGFDAFESALVAGAATVLPAYHAYYEAYLSAVQDDAVNAALKVAPPPPSATDIHCSYTVVHLAAEGGGFTTVPFATHFAKALQPVLAGFDTWIDNCIAASQLISSSPSSSSPPWDSAAREAYVTFLKQYRKCLALESDSATLEAEQVELDRLWMDTRMPIQLIHDIETGYGDPLRCKATPDLSLRFLDETFSKQNASIADIQQRMMAFYASRDTPLAKSGLAALGNTMAGIYFIPFKTGASLVFSFSGQSIPNREQVKVEKGVKIYFDAVETAARVEINKALVKKVYHDADAVIHKWNPNAVEMLVWHVAAHEVGHAIYNLEAVHGCFSVPGNKTLLEEPRAELTAMFTLKLLHEQDVLDRAHLDASLAHFALDALRYFDKYDSEGLRPYCIFQCYAHKVYHKHGYLSVHAESGKLVLDPAKTLAVLDDFAGCFLEILDAMDANDGGKLEKILTETMAPETAFVRETLALVRGQ